MSDDRPAITQQYSFAVGEDGETDGAIEPAEETVETDLETWGADVDHRERDSRIDQPEATSFGVDDRPEVTSGDGGEQGALFVQADDDQRTLTGERATSQCLFGSDNDESNEPNEAATDDKPDTAASVSDEATTTRPVATDGGHVEDPGDDDDECDSADRSAQADASAVVTVPRPKLACITDALDDERRTIERNAGTEPRTAMLAEYVANCRNTLSILDESDERAPINRPVANGAVGALEAAAKTETGDYAEELRELADVLRRALEDRQATDEDPDEDGDGDADRESDTGTATESSQGETFDPDKKTVTDAWEGAFVQASWGYNQTNVELAQIVEVSESGKTVLARFVTAERVGHGRTSKQLRPTAEQYGDEFRLHVRNVSDDPVFRGSYPLGPDGDMDGRTRRESFYPFDNREGNSIRATRTNCGH